MHLGYNNKQCGETSLRNSSYWIHTFLRCDSTRETRTHTNIHTLTVIAVYSLLNPVLGSENSQISSLSHQSEDLSHKCPPPCPAERLSVFQPADSKKKRKKSKSEQLKTDRERERERERERKRERESSAVLELCHCANAWICTASLSVALLPPSLPQSFLQGQWVEVLI